MITGIRPLTDLDIKDSCLSLRRSHQLDDCEDYMPTGRCKIAQGKEIFVYPGRTIEFNAGDSIPPVIELDGAAESLAGGVVFEGTDVPVEYVHYYLENGHNLHTFFSDYPSVSHDQALTAIEERVLRI